MIGTARQPHLFEMVARSRSGGNRGGVLRTRPLAASTAPSMSIRPHDGCPPIPAHAWAGRPWARMPVIVTCGGRDGRRGIDPAHLVDQAGIVPSTVLISAPRSGPWVRPAAAAVRSSQAPKRVELGDPRDVDHDAGVTCRRAFFGVRRRSAPRAARTGAGPRPHPAQSASPPPCAHALQYAGSLLTCTKLPTANLVPAWLRIKCRAA